MENKEDLILVKVKWGVIMISKKGVIDFFKRRFGARQAQSHFKDPRRGYDNYVMQTGPIAAERAMEIEQKEKVQKLLDKTQVVLVLVPVNVSSQNHSTVYAAGACAVACDAGSC
ncbi:MAG TPA: hypothetical protein IAC45_00070 [Candidatus Aphodousia faecavium]|nr:hypothetical protein [Candidatus Aphodousia faecavium]